MGWEVEKIICRHIGWLRNAGSWAEKLRNSRLGNYEVERLTGWIVVKLEVGVPRTCEAATLGYRGFEKPQSRHAGFVWSLEIRKLSS